MIASERLEQDARSAATDVLEMLLSDGLEFFNRYSDLQECSVGLNAPIKARTHQLCNNFPLRAYYGVVAAALTQPERVPSLIQSYVDFALQSGAAEMMMYEVGKELSGVDAIALRLKFLSEIARATSL
ncbi:MAG: hypothetical protein EON96_05975 [Caulobacteraceae bacterium]|nr:MAG: hypothetical protein EON96_05975 [Caulobacteraceae bacterium]